MALPSEVRIVEVGPRDGLQNEARHVPASVRIALIERLADAGLKTIEAAAFVSARWVPQMADSGAVLQGMQCRPGVQYPVLVPNLQGLAAAIAAGAQQVAVFPAASESFSRRNLNCSIAEGLARAAQVSAEAARLGIPVRGYVSCALGCPYEGAVAVEHVAQCVEQLLAMGCYEVSLGDTIGVGTPGSARRLLDAVGRRVPVAQLAGHYHDTYGMALANILASLEFGVAVFDSSVAGLGGCPYAPGASGNVATEELVYLLDGLGIVTGIDLERLIDAGAFICAALGRATRSRVASAMLARRC
jgi:hydroxymethylglutaryl-CoA lyase